MCVKMELKPNKKNMVYWNECDLGSLPDRTRVQDQAWDRDQGRGWVRVPGQGRVRAQAWLGLEIEVRTPLHTNSQLPLTLVSLLPFAYIFLYPIHVPTCVPSVGDLVVYISKPNICSSRPDQCLLYPL